MRAQPLIRTVVALVALAFINAAMVPDPSLSYARAWWLRFAAGAMLAWAILHPDRHPAVS